MPYALTPSSHPLFLEARRFRAPLIVNSATSARAIWSTYHAIPEYLQFQPDVQALVRKRSGQW